MGKLRDNKRASKRPYKKSAELPECTQSETNATVCAVRGFDCLVLADSELDDIDSQSEQAGPRPANKGHAKVVVGDRVRIERDKVLAMAPRTTLLSRPSSHNPREQKLLAANVETAVITLAVGDRTGAGKAPIRVGLVDRILLALERGGGVQPVLCINKWDQIEGDDESEIAEAVKPYEGFMPIVRTSVTSGVGIEELAAAVRGRTCVFIGKSGVGKSSLLNAIDPSVDRKTSEVRDADRKGRHTTTASSLSEMADGTRVIDTPGIRSFGLWDIDRKDLPGWFPDFETHAVACRFRDCLHDQEPDCAVRQAAEDGRVSAVRYATYLRLLSDT